MRLDIVVVPFHDWKKGQAEGFRTRDAHLMQELSQHPRVDKLLVIDRPISIPEIVLLRRPWRIHGRHVYQRGQNCLTQVNQKTYVLDTLVLDPFGSVLKRRRWIPWIFGKPAIRQSVLQALEFLNIHDYILFLSSPLSVPLYRQLHPRMLVMDAVDNFTKHATFTKMRSDVEKFYEEIRLEAAVIFANSIETADWLSKGREQVIYIPNGVNFHRFQSLKNEAPDDLQRIPRPIVGYAGKMQDMFDVEMLRSVAHSLPDVSFVCIGQLLNPRWMKPLWSCPNIYYLGDKHYDLLPNYLVNFDICMIPYSVQRQHGGDPIKFYEYLAVGKPVVTTNIGGVSAFSHLPGVKIVADSAGFSKAVWEFLDCIHRGERVPVSTLPPDVLWSTKTDLMINAIVKKIAIGYVQADPRMLSKRKP